ncbi:MAG: hypothetical protein ACTS85_00860 [Arsenophonus sp. NC-PG7-MAG3]
MTFYFLVLIDVEKIFYIVEEISNNNLCQHSRKITLVTLTSQSIFKFYQHLICLLFSEFRCCQTRIVDAQLGLWE